MPDSYVSNRILNGIRLNRPEVFSEVPNRFRDRLADLVIYYSRETSYMLRGASLPRNFPFYRLIKRHYARFTWQNGKTQIDIEAYHNGRKQSLLTYLLGLIPSDEVATSARISLATGSSAAIAMMEIYQPAFDKLGVCHLSEGDVDRLNRWLAKGKAGQQVTIISPVCPDYSAAPGRDRKYRFTFDSVGTGCGLSGARLLESLEELHDLFRVHFGCAALEHHVCIGDFEAFNESNVQRVGLTAQEFVARNRISASTIKAASPVDIKTSLFTDHCGGRDGWEKRYHVMLLRFERGDFALPMKAELVREIGLARRELYRRWYGDKASDPAFLERLVISQGAEYALMGEIIEEQFHNPLILGADHHKMAPFYNFSTDIPVIYLDRNYD